MPLSHRQQIEYKPAKARGYQTLNIKIFILLLLLLTTLTSAYANGIELSPPTNSTSFIGPKKQHRKKTKTRRYVKMKESDVRSVGNSKKFRRLRSASAPASRAPANCIMCTFHITTSSPPPPAPTTHNSNSCNAFGLVTGLLGILGIVALFWCHYKSRNKRRFMPFSASPKRAFSAYDNGSEGSRLQYLKPIGQQSVSKEAAYKRYEKINSSFRQSKQVAAVEVLLLDSGVDIRHETLKGRHAAGNICAYWDYTLSGPTDNSSSLRDEFGHGTAIADIIGRWAPSAVIYSARVCRGGEPGTIPLDAVVKAIEKAAMDPDRKFQLIVIPMAFESGPGDKELKRVINLATDKGITVIAAGGNSGDNTICPYPGESVRVALVPPESWDPNTKFTKYGYESGTSFAAGVLAGISATLLGMIAADPKKDDLEAKTIRRKFATVLSKMKVKGKKGYINPVAAGWTYEKYFG